MKHFHFQNAELVKEKIHVGRSALWMAADYGQSEIIELLLARGAAVNVSITVCVGAFSKGDLALD